MHSSYQKMIQRQRPLSSITRFTTDTAECLTLRLFKIAMTTGIIVYTDSKQNINLLQEISILQK